MAISDTNKTNYVFKKTKGKATTLFARPFYEETLGGSFLMDGSDVFAESLPDNDPTTAVSSGLATAYGAASALRLTPINGTESSGHYYGYIVCASYPSAAPYVDKIGNWISARYGLNYSIRLWNGDPNAGGVEIPSSDASDWLFDERTGIVVFQDTPPTLTSGLWITGYVYAGDTVLGLDNYWQRVDDITGGVIYPKIRSTIDRLLIGSNDIADANILTLRATSFGASGIVEKIAYSNWVIGTGSSFTTQISVGDFVNIAGGGGTEYRRITRVVDDEHLVVDADWHYGASGQSLYVDRAYTRATPSILSTEFLVGYQGKIFCGATSLEETSGTGTNFLPVGGGALNDMLYSGTYVGPPASSEFIVKIDGEGSPDTFTWSNDGGGSWNPGVSITGAAQLLSNGISVQFVNLTGHRIDDQWSFTRPNTKYYSRFPYAQALFSKSNTGYSLSTTNFGVVGESISDGSLYAVGLCGLSKVGGTRAAYAVYGCCGVNSPTYSGDAVGGYFTAAEAHTAGLNIAIKAEASGATGTGTDRNNYCLYSLTGDVYVQNKIRVGSTPSWDDFTEATAIVSRNDTTLTYTAAQIGLVGEGSSGVSSDQYGVGLMGLASFTTYTDCMGVWGEAHPINAASTHRAIGVFGQSNKTHTSGVNAAFVANAENGNFNYSFYGEHGDIKNLGDIAGYMLNAGESEYTKIYGVVANPTTTVTVGSPTAGGSVDDGDHKYKVIFVTSEGETAGSDASDTVTCGGGNNTVLLSNVPVSPNPRVTIRRIYRSKIGDLTTFYYAGAIADNVTTVYSDSIDDASLGAVLGNSNTTSAVYVSNSYDSANVCAHVLDTGRTFGSSGVKLLSIRQLGTEKAYVNKDGLGCFIGGVDVRDVAAGSPSLYITATTDSPSASWGASAGVEVSVAPSGWMEIRVGTDVRYIPFWA